jgi:hypothetical protein
LTNACSGPVFLHVAVEADKQFQNLSLFGASHLFLELIIRLGEPMARRGHGGRPYKGDRDHIVTRPSRVVGDLVRQRAEEAGLTISDYVAAVLARAHGVPEAAPLNRDPEQEVLPLGKTA